MSRILVVYYSSYGHVEEMAYAQADGAARVSGTEAVVKRVPELVPPDVARASGFKLDQRAPLAEPEELAQYDALIVGTPTRFGNMCAQMRNFWDRTGPLWMSDALVGKLGSVFTSTASQHGGQETTIIATQITLLHHGMIIIGLPYSHKELSSMSEVQGGTPYGASCITGAGNEYRMPTQRELLLSRYQGEHVAKITKQYVAGRNAA